VCQLRPAPFSAGLYHDWVVKVFNDNLPFDQFIVRQLAEDLLPDGWIWGRARRSTAARRRSCRPWWCRRPHAHPAGR
jgi:hypothetical protein